MCLWVAWYTRDVFHSLVRSTENCNISNDKEKYNRDMGYLRGSRVAGRGSRIVPS